MNIIFWSKYIGHGRAGSAAVRLKPQGKCLYMPRTGEYEECAHKGMRDFWREVAERHEVELIALQSGFIDTFATPVDLPEEYA